MHPLLHFVLLSSALNYPALTFVSLEYPIQLIFKGITHVCVCLVTPHALYFQWKHPLTTNTVYLMFLLDISLLQNTAPFAFRTSHQCSAVIALDLLKDQQMQAKFKTPQDVRLFIKEFE